MEITYLIITVFMLILAALGLFVGVSNDAVNFLSSAIGARAGTFKTILVVASVGVMAGALMSAGMMDVARHGIMQPTNFTFREVMIVFMAVVATNIIVLDRFNDLGLPTSSTVTLVFGLLGATFVLSLVKIHADSSLSLSTLMNTDKALSLIIAIFASVAIAFVCGLIVQWLSRLVFTFNLQGNSCLTHGIFGGLSFTVLAYFIFIETLSESPLIAEDFKVWIAGNTPLLLGITFAVASILSAILYSLRVNVLRIIVLSGTFALAMAFAGNDLVNFIGIPLAGLDSYQDWSGHGATDINSYMMSSLAQSARSPFVYLAIAGVLMIIAMATSKKAHHVVQTSVDLSRQDEGDEMFGTSQAARSLVRAVQDSNDRMRHAVPRHVVAAIDRRFDKSKGHLEDNAAFDMLRAAINLVLSSALIIVGTNYKLPLSTTYVTFMVAMGTSLADHAWTRDSAVYRVTGVLSVIGSWLITAGITFAACALVCLLMHLGGIPVMLAMMAVVVYTLVRSHIRFGKGKQDSHQEQLYKLMMRSCDPEIVWNLLQRHISQTQSTMCRFTLQHYDQIIDGLAHERVRQLRDVGKDLRRQQDELKRTRRKEFLSLRRIPRNIALERNTWFHLGANSNQQYVYTLKRMLEPVKEHVDNNFSPLPESYLNEFAPMRHTITELMEETVNMLESRDFTDYKRVMSQADKCKDDLSQLREQLIDNMQGSDNSSSYRTAIIYLTMLQESQEMLSIMRHQLRAASKLLA
ncbi:MAG: inorganic phosphate transporter [Muribaculaceae bacterium]|nr:inorganic phosphate transporter [Muribaculaceae bacterium]